MHGSSCKSQADVCVLVRCVVEGVVEMEPSSRQAESHGNWFLAKGQIFECRKRPLVMGVVNVTADSFYDGGRYLDRHRAVAHALQLVEQGADILDIGGESRMSAPCSTS